MSVVRNAPSAFSSGAVDRDVPPLTLGWDERPRRREWAVVHPAPSSKPRRVAPLIAGGMAIAAKGTTQRTPNLQKKRWPWP